MCLGPLSAGRDGCRLACPRRGAGSRGGRQEMVFPPTMDDAERRLAQARVMREARAAARLNPRRGHPVRRRPGPRRHPHRDEAGRRAPRRWRPGATPTGSRRSASAAPYRRPVRGRSPGRRPTRHASGRNGRTQHPSASVAPVGMRLRPQERPKRREVRGARRRSPRDRSAAFPPARRRPGAAQRAGGRRPR